MSSASEERQNRRLARRREKQAVEPLYENSALRDNLDDAQALAVLKWGAEQIASMVRLTAVLPEAEADPVIDSRATAVQRALHWLNTAVAENVPAEDINLDKLWDALGHMVALPAELPSTVEAWWTKINQLPPAPRFAQLHALLQQPDRWSELDANFEFSAAVLPESEPVADVTATPKTRVKTDDPAYSSSKTGRRRPQQF